MSDGPFIFGPPTIWVAPADTPLSECGDDVYDPDGPWTLIYPTVPDTPAAL